MTQEVFNSSTTWTCPAGVTSVDIECWGSGSNGANGDGFFFGGVGGGGGAYSLKSALAVTPGHNYGINVAASNDGGNTSFDAGGDCKALSATASSPTGGLASGGVGDTKYSGGDGNNVVAGSDGGGGGGSAGTNAGGGNGSGSGGGTAGTDGGNGGNGGVNPANGVAGSAPGGGGGGGSRSGTGAAGAAGRLRLTYTAAGGSSYVPPSRMMDPGLLALLAD